MHFLQEKRLRREKLRIVVTSARKEDEEEMENCTLCKKRGGRN